MIAPGGKNWDFNSAKLLLDYRRRVVAALGRAATVTQNAIVRQMGAHGGGIMGSASPAGQPPGVRTGALRRSIQIDRSRVDTEYRVRVGSTLPYARVQEYGGRIVGKGKKLAIPFPGNRRARLYSPRRAPVKLVLIARPGKSALLVEERKGGKSGKGARTTPWYILVPSVKLPPRPYMRPGLAAARPGVLRAFGRLVGGQG